MYKDAGDIPFVFDYKVLAEVLGVSTFTARTIMNSDGFPLHKLSPRKHRIFKGEFLRWMNGERFETES